MLYQSKLQSTADENILQVMFPGAKSRGVGAHLCLHPCLPWGWRERHPPTPRTQGKAQTVKVVSPLSLPSKEEGRVARSPLPCRAPQVLYPPSSLCQIPNGNQQHIQE